jgi:hypothetical protein
VTLPANWPGKKVSMDIYNMSGVRVKHTLKEAASSTESIDVNNLQPGVYVVKANAGNETATQQIVK